MKKNTILYIIIVILLCALTGSITYIVAANNNETEINEKPNNNQEENNNKEEEPVLKDGITLKDTYQEGETIIQEYEIILNGKKNNIDINYTYEECQENIICISGIYNNYGFYYNEINNPNINSFFNIQKINQLVNIDNFDIIKGTDNKSYLLIYADTMLYILDDQLNIVNDGIKNPNWYEGDNSDGFVITSFVNIPILDYYYEDSLNICDNQNYDDCHIYVKVENNKIYYLTPNISYHEEYLNHVYDENYEVEVEERLYTINNNKLTYEVINTYPVLEVVNGI